MNITRALGAAAIVVLCSADVTARAQSAAASHFGRTTTGAVPNRRGRELPRVAAPNQPADDPLAPYTSRPRGGVSGEPVAIVPRRPAARPVVRNYFPTARVGRYASPAAQGGHHCTPSRAFAIGMSR